MDVAARDLGMRCEDRLRAVKWAMPNTGLDESRMRIFWFVHHPNKPTSV